MQEYAKDAFTGSIPIASSGSFDGCCRSILRNGTPSNFINTINNTDSQGLVEQITIQSINLLANQDILDIM